MRSKIRETTHEKFEDWSWGNSRKGTGARVYMEIFVLSDRALNEAEQVLDMIWEPQIEVWEAIETKLRLKL